MKHKNLVFLDGVLLAEYDEWPQAGRIPNGTYLLTKQGDWYRKYRNNSSPINLCDVPKELRLAVVLMT